MTYKIQGSSILVTGAAGFIGSHLCEKLLNLGANVIGVDNLSTGTLRNIDHLNNNKRFSFFKIDANSMSDMEQMFKSEIDFVFHYAAVLGVKRVEENPLSVLKDINGIENICILSKKNGVKKLIYASSSEAYGDIAEIPLIEDKISINKHSNHSHIYALVKLIGERIISTYNQKYDLPTCSLRFFNVYGPKQESSAYGFVVGVFIRQLINSQNPTIFGDGYQTRDFIYIDDNIELSVKALCSKKTDGEIINIGSGRQITILDLAEKLIKISGKSIEPKFLPNRINEIRYRVPDVSKMEKLLGKIQYSKMDINLEKTFFSYKKDC